MVAAVTKGKRNVLNGSAPNAFLERSECTSVVIPVHPGPRHLCLCTRYDDLLYKLALIFGDLVGYFYDTVVHACASTMATWRVPGTSTRASTDESRNSKSASVCTRLLVTTYW